jgi:hypothetical protein
MAVMLIFTLLLGIMVPTISTIRVSALNSKTRTIVTTIAGGCQIYESDHQMYPPSAPVSPFDNGAERVVQCLVGYQNESGDGHKGPGFRIKRPGPVYGPYNNCEELDRNKTQGRYVFEDPFGSTILYYRYGADGYVTDHNPNGPENIQAYATGPDGRLFTESFLVLSPGPDEVYGPAPYHDGGFDRDCDDIFNFTLP